MKRMATITRRMERYMLNYLTTKSEATIPEIQRHLRDIGKLFDKPKVLTVLRHMEIDNKVVREIRLTDGGAKRVVYKPAPASQRTDSAGEGA